VLVGDLVLYCWYWLVVEYSIVCVGWWSSTLLLVLVGDLLLYCLCWLVIKDSVVGIG
jgi:hypothetical protein